MREILPNIDKASKEPMYLQLYKYIRDEIEKGFLGQGERLPSIRVLAGKLGISVTTIRTAYDQLSMEGYLINREKSGYYVGKLDYITEAYSMAYSFREQAERAQNRDPMIYDEECFDFVRWKKCCAHVLTHETKALLAEADVQGELRLREQIAKYVFQSRGVHSRAEEIVLGAGTQALINILAAILRRDGKQTIGFENPTYTMNQQIFDAQGFLTFNFALDKEGLLPDERAKKMQLLYVSPSHQFPTGIVMSAQRRSQLLAWATEQKSYVIEDDYDSELRYFGRPIPALKAMDKASRVIYMGSFSSTLLPSIRISYLVLPDALLDIYKKLKHTYAQGVSKVDQLTLCKFMEEGHYQRHIRRIRRLYSEKSARLSELFALHPRTRVISDTSGLFMIVEFDSSKSESQLAEKFVRVGIKATPLGSYYKTGAASQMPRLLIYFYNIEGKWLIDTIKKLCDEMD